VTSLEASRQSLEGKVLPANRAFDIEPCVDRSECNKLNITRREFEFFYPDIAEYYDLFNDPVPHNISDEDFEAKYLTSKLWRLNNCYTIINKDGAPVTFRMNFGQHKVYAASRVHPRVIILKSRQQGISTLWLVSYFDDAVFCPFLNLGLMAQGTDEASTLLERTKFLWDMLDDSIKSFIGVSLEKDNTKEYAFSNKSTIFIRVSFRSTTLQRLHVSEFGKIANNYPKRAKETKTGTLQALGKGNTGIIESTAEGRNMFKQMWDDSVLVENSTGLSVKDFKPIFLSWLDDPDCLNDVEQPVDGEAADYFAKLEEQTGRKLSKEQKNFWIIQRRELGGDIFQEYPATPEEAFTASRDGTYYSRLFNESVVRKGRVVSGLYDPNLPVDVYFDLGVDDYFVVGFVQWYRDEWRLVDEYWNNGYAITHYIDEVISRGYTIRDWNFPHDIRQRSLTNANSSGQAKSREDIVREYIRDNQIPGRVMTLAKESIADGIEAVRRMIPKMRVDKRCSYLMECALNYSKEWDDKQQVWKQTPVHDEYSHGADVLRSIACNTVENREYHRSPYEGRQQRARMSGFDV